jgi:pyruvate kinase
MKRLAKIIATIGPASASPPMLKRLVETGTSLFRLNFSHGDHEHHGAVVDRIRAVERELGTPVGIIADLQGPKIRLGDIEGGERAIGFGEVFTLEISDRPGTAETLRLPHPEIAAAAKPGDQILVDDGKLIWIVEAATPGSIRVRALTPGTVTPRKGVTLVGGTLPIPALTDKDREDLAFALEKGVDWVALSFVQSRADVDEAMGLIKGRAGLIAKIEKPSALDDLPGIIDGCDAIMIARGDLGVELPLERVPIEQRRIIKLTRTAGKPVIVATQMLESMISAATPTRAEASDVATAIYQGADAVMLSAESAVGRHPESAVAIMDRIITAVETEDEYWERLDRPRPQSDLTTADAVASAAARLVDDLDCAACVTYTRTGSTATRIARERPRAEILALTPDEQVGRRLTLTWGVFSRMGPDISSFEEMIDRAEDEARASGLSADDRIVIVAGAPFGEPGKTNTIKVSRL